VKKLSDINMDALERLIRFTIEYYGEKFGKNES